MSDPNQTLRIKLGQWARKWTSRNPYTNVYGVARTLLALASAGTIAFTPLHVLFTPVSGVNDVPRCDGASQLSIFCASVAHLNGIRWLSVALLILVASGWRPRFTAIPHAWISYSFFSSSTIFDGGDQITLVLTVLLLPVALLDSRRWHWSTPHANISSLSRLIAWSAFLMIRIQVAGVYFVSGISKLAQTEWANGTAMYYWLLTFGGAPRWVVAIARQPVLLVGMTWGAIALEVVLAVALVLPRRTWRPLLILGIGFHVLIAFFFGLTSFSTAMTAALILFLRPADEEFRLGAIHKKETEGINADGSFPQSDLPIQATEPSDSTRQSL